MFALDTDKRRTEQKRNRTETYRDTGEGLRMYVNDTSSIARLKIGIFKRLGFSH